MKSLVVCNRNSSMRSAISGDTGLDSKFLRLFNHLRTNRNWRNDQYSTIGFSYDILGPYKGHNGFSCSAVTKDGTPSATDCPRSQEFLEIKKVVRHKDRIRSVTTYQLGFLV